MPPLVVGDSARKLIPRAVLAFDVKALAPGLAPLPQDAPDFHPPPVDAQAQRALICAKAAVALDLD